MYTYIYTGRSRPCSQHSTISKRLWYFQLVLARRKTLPPRSRARRLSPPYSGHSARIVWRCLFAHWCVCVVCVCCCEWATSTTRLTLWESIVALPLCPLVCVYCVLWVCVCVCVCVCEGVGVWGFVCMWV